MPKRPPAEATKATWTAIVTSARPPVGSERPSSTWTPKAAATPASRPATFAAVPRRSMRSSLTGIVSRAARRASLEVAEAAQAFLDLALLVVGEYAGGRTRPALLVRRGLEADRASIIPAKSASEISGLGGCALPGPAAT